MSSQQRAAGTTQNTNHAMLSKCQPAPSPSKSHHAWDWLGFLGCTPCAHTPEAGAHLRQGRFGGVPAACSHAIPMPCPTPLGAFAFKMGFYTGSTCQPAGLVALHGPCTSTNTGTASRPISQTHSFCSCRVWNARLPTLRLGWHQSKKLKYCSRSS